jgi:hypothetical protein
LLLVDDTEPVRTAPLDEEDDDADLPELEPLLLLPAEETVVPLPIVVAV